MGVVGRLDQYGSMLTSEFDEITANNPSVTGLGTYYSSEFSENIVDIVRNGLVLNLDAGNLSSYPGSGTTWTDVSGGGNNGTLTNGPTYSSANGGSIVFDGTNDYVDLGAFFTYQTFTISIWVYPGATQNQYANIFDNNHTGTRNFVLQQNNLTTNQYSFGVSDASGGISGSDLINLTANVWTHLSFTFSPTSRVIAYVNGTFHSQGALAGGRNIFYKSQFLRLCAWGGGGRIWNGRISNFSVYTRELSAAEVTQNYNALKNRFEILTPSSVTSGLVLNLDAGNPASYPGSGTTWTDLSGNGNNGTLVNGPTYSSANGGSIVFDGTNDEVTTTTQFTNPQTFSIGAWFKTSTASGNKIIGFENAQTGTGSFQFDRHIWIGTDGKLNFGIYSGGGVIATSPLTYADNTWHYVIATYGGEGTTMRLYVDGASVATASAASAAAYNGYWRIGAYQSWGLSGYFPGSISLAQVYNRGITAAEVLQNYNSTIERFLTPLTSNFFMRQNRDKSVIVYNEIDEIADIRDIVRSGLVFDLDAGMNTSYPGFGTTWNDISSPPISAATGALPIYNTTDIYGATKDIGTRIDTNASSLVLAVPMDGANNGTTFTDESATIRGSGTAKAITVNGNTKTLTAVSKFYGSSGYFDGTGDYLTCASSADFNIGTGDYTFETWIYKTTSSNRVVLLAIAGAGLSISINTSGNIEVNRSLTAIDFTFTASIQDNTWTHIAVTRFGTSLRAFKDGALLSTQTSSTSYGQGICYIGIDANASTTPFVGYIQDLRVYKGVAKYTSNFTPPGNPTNKIGTLTNGPTYSTANAGSIVFDGSNDYVQTNFNYSLTSSTTEFTCATWYKCVTGATDNGLIFSNYQATPNPFNLYANVNGKARGFTRNSGGSSVFVTSLTSVNDDAWHYVVYTKTGSDTYKLYVDGNLEATATASLGTITVSNNIVLGTLNYYISSAPQAFYRGNLAQASIYNRSLSAAEVTQNYNALRNRYGL